MLSPGNKKIREKGFKREAAQGQKAIDALTGHAPILLAVLACLMDMHVLLRIGNADALPVKFHLYLPDYIPMDLPIIIGLHPGPANEVD